MDWIAYCTVCGELERAPNGPMMESAARLHRRDTGHMTIIGYEPELTKEEKESRRVVERAHEFLDRISQPLDIESLQGRPFPQTYGDWVSLAEDIKGRCQGEPATIATVNYQLNTILGAEQGTETPGAAEEAKRWLVNKAAELGLK